MVETYLQKNHSQCDKTCNYMESTGKKRRCRPKITWQRSVESEMREMCLSWGRLDTKTEMPGGLLLVAYALVKERKGYEIDDDFIKKTIVSYFSLVQPSKVKM
jgi:hypothetical protein